MQLLPIILIAAVMFANVVAFLDYDFRRTEARGEAEDRAARVAAYRNRARTIETLQRFAASSEARGLTIDARNFRARADRIAAWQSADDASAY